MTTNFSFSFKIWLEPGSKNLTVGALWDICIAINDRCLRKQVNSLVSDHPWCTTKWSLTGRWSLTGKINKISVILDRLVNYIKILP